MWDVLNPFEFGNLLTSAGGGDLDALALLDRTGIPDPGQPGFAELLSPMDNDAGLALNGNPWGMGGLFGNRPNYGAGAPAMMRGNPNFPLPTGAAYPSPMSGLGGGDPDSTYRGQPQVAGPFGGAGNLMRGLGQGLGQPPRTPLPGTQTLPKGLADTTHKAPAGPTPAQLLLAALGLNKGRMGRQQ